MMIAIRVMSLNPGQKQEWWHSLCKIHIGIHIRMNWKYKNHLNSVLVDYTSLPITVFTRLGIGITHLGLTERKNLIIKRKN